MASTAENEPGKRGYCISSGALAFVFVALLLGSLLMCPMPCIAWAASQLQQQGAASPSGLQDGFVAQAGSQAGSKAGSGSIP